MILGKNASLEYSWAFSTHMVRLQIKDTTKFTQFIRTNQELPEKKSKFAKFSGSTHRYIGTHKKYPIKASKRTYVSTKSMVLQG